MRLNGPQRPSSLAGAISPFGFRHREPRRFDSLEGARNRHPPRAFGIRLQPAPHSLLARLGGQPSKGGHMLVEAAQERVGVGLPPERYEREDRFQAPRRSGDQRRTDKWPGIGRPVNKNIQWQGRPNERGQGPPSGYR